MNTIVEQRVPVAWVFMETLREEDPAFQIIKSDFISFLRMFIAFIGSIRHI
ncbi:MAG: hypothetical protein KIS67_05375 [Verrucomicrobiae bacterium]|nr:hypothetical protein [Verrucomicrobiae bacterium]